MLLSEQALHMQQQVEQRAVGAAVIDAESPGTAQSIGKIGGFVAVGVAGNEGAQLLRIEGEEVLHRRFPEDLL